MPEIQLTGECPTLSATTIRHTSHFKWSLLTAKRLHGARANKLNIRCEIATAPERGATDRISHTGFTRQNRRREARHFFPARHSSRLACAGPNRRPFYAPSLDVPRRTRPWKLHISPRCFSARKKGPLESERERESYCFSLSPGTPQVAVKSLCIDNGAFFYSSPISAGTQIHTDTQTPTDALL